MLCPHCHSDQTTSYEVGYGVHYLECVNCDYEGLVEETPGDKADHFLQEGDIHHGIEHHYVP